MSNHHLRRINRLGKTRCAPYSDWRGSRLLAREDLSGWGLIGADMRGVDLSGTRGRHVDLRCADMRGANLEEADTSTWLMQGTNLDYANLRGATIGATMHGATMLHAEMEGVHWVSGGRRCYGLRLGGRIPFETWSYGCGCHPVMAKALMQLWPQDPEVGLLVNAVLAEPFRYDPAAFPCWSGALAYVENHLSHRQEELVAGARTYPGMLLAERLELARLARDTADKAALRKTKYYEWFKFDIDLAIRNEREDADADAE